MVFTNQKYKYVRIGRKKKIEIELKDNWFSRIHTSFEFDKDQQLWYLQDGIEDLKSTNGTWYNIF